MRTQSEIFGGESKFGLSLVSSVAKNFVDSGRPDFAQPSLIDNAYCYLPFSTNLPIGHTVTRYVEGVNLPNASVSTRSMYCHAGSRASLAALSGAATMQHNIVSLIDKSTNPFYNVSNYIWESSGREFVKPGKSYKNLLRFSHFKYGTLPHNFIEGNDNFPNAVKEGTLRINYAHEFPCAPARTYNLRGDIAPNYQGSIAFRTISIKKGLTYCFSVYARADSWNKCQLSFGVSSSVIGTSSAIFDLKSGQVDNASSVLTARSEHIYDGIYRISVIFRSVVTENLRPVMGLGPLPTVIGGLPMKNREITFSHPQFECVEYGSEFPYPPLGNVGEPTTTFSYNETLDFYFSGSSVLGYLGQDRERRQYVDLIMGGGVGTHLFLMNTRALPLIGETYEGRFSLSALEKIYGSQIPNDNAILRMVIEERSSATDFSTVTKRTVGPNIKITDMDQSVTSMTLQHVAGNSGTFLSLGFEIVESDSNFTPELILKLYNPQLEKGTIGDEFVATRSTVENSHYRVLDFNQDFVGATTSKLPDNWSQTLDANGITRNIVQVGSLVNGLKTIDIQLIGTMTDPESPTPKRYNLVCGSYSNNNWSVEKGSPSWASQLFLTDGSLPTGCRIVQYIKLSNGSIYETDCQLDETARRFEVTTGEYVSVDTISAEFGWYIDLPYTNRDVDFTINIACPVGLSHSIHVAPEFCPKDSVVQTPTKTLPMNWVAEHFNSNSEVLTVGAGFDGVSLAFISNHTSTVNQFINCLNWDAYMPNHQFKVCHSAYIEVVKSKRTSSGIASYPKLAYRNSGGSGTVVYSTNSRSLFLAYDVVPSSSSITGPNACGVLLTLPDGEQNIIVKITNPTTSNTMYDGDVATEGHPTGRMEFQGTWKSQMTRNFVDQTLVINGNASPNIRMTYDNFDYDDVGDFCINPSIRLSGSDRLIDLHFPRYRVSTTPSTHTLKDISAVTDIKNHFWEYCNVGVYDASRFLLVGSPFSDKKWTAYHASHDGNGVVKTRSDTLVDIPIVSASDINIFRRQIWSQRVFCTSTYGIVASLSSDETKYQCVITDNNNIAPLFGGVINLIDLGVDGADFVCDVSQQSNDEFLVFYASRTIPLSAVFCKITDKDTVRIVDTRGIASAKCLETLYQKWSWRFVGTSTGTGTMSIDNNTLNLINGNTAAQTAAQWHADVLSTRANHYHAFAYSELAVVGDTVTATNAWPGSRNQFSSSTPQTGVTTVYTQIQAPKSNSLYVMKREYGVHVVSFSNPGDAVYGYTFGVDAASGKVRCIDKVESYSPEGYNYLHRLSQDNKLWMIGPYGYYVDRFGLMKPARWLMNIGGLMEFSGKGPIITKGNLLASVRRVDQGNCSIGVRSFVIHPS